MLKLKPRLSGLISESPLIKDLPLDDLPSTHFTSIIIKSQDVLDNYKTKFSISNLSLHLYYF